MGKMLGDWQILIEIGATHPCVVILVRWSALRAKSESLLRFTRPDVNVWATWLKPRWGWDRVL